MSKFRTMVALSPGFVKVMPFRCTGVNNLIFESYTNNFEEIDEGLVCIFKAENDNSGPVRVQLSKMKEKLKMLTPEGEELPSGVIRGNKLYQASYDGINLILHLDNSNIDIEEGKNVTIYKKPNGNVVINCIGNDNTWRPMSDRLDININDTYTCASSNAARILNEKIEAIKVVVEDNGNIQENLADIVISIISDIAVINQELSNKSDSNHIHKVATDEEIDAIFT